MEYVYKIKSFATSVQNTWGKYVRNEESRKE